jgi:hypothetical protein
VCHEAPTCGLTARRGTVPTWKPPRLTPPLNSNAFAGRGTTTTASAVNGMSGPGLLTALSFLREPSLTREGSRVTTAEPTIKRSERSRLGGLDACTRSGRTVEQALSGAGAQPWTSFGRP